MKLRLSWTDPTSRRPRRPLLNTPIALGQTFTAMPAEISGKSVSRMVIGDCQIHDFQALIVEVEGELYLINNSGGQTSINQQKVSGQERLEHGNRIHIGQTELELQIMDAPPSTPSQCSTHLQGVETTTIQPSPSSINGNGNGNGYHRTNLNEPDQAHLSNPGISNPGISNPGKGSDSQLNDQSRHSNGNGGSQPQPISPPSPSPLNGQPSHSPKPVPNDQQLPPVLQSNGNLRPPNKQPISNKHKLSQEGHHQFSGFASPAPIQRQPQPQVPQERTPSPSTAGAPLALPVNPSNSGCQRIVGFLFKRTCGLKNSSRCDRCANGYSNHAYSADYELYEGFGHFEPGDWGYDLLENQKKR